MIRRRRHELQPELIPVQPFQRDGHFNTVLWISTPDYIPDQLKQRYPAALEKDAPLAILRPSDIKAIIWGIEVGEYVDFMLRPYRDLIHIAAELYVEKEKIADLARVRLSKAEHGKLVDLALKSIAVIERHDAGYQKKNEWW